MPIVKTPYVMNAPKTENTDPRYMFGATGEKQTSEKQPLTVPAWAIGLGGAFLLWKLAK